jgi:hypothetical protein
LSADYFLGGFKAQAANQDSVAKAGSQIIDGVFRKRRAAIDQIGRIGRVRGIKRIDPDAEQAKSRTIGLVL